MVPWTNVMAMKVKMAQLYPTLCDLMIYTVHGILQARILEWANFSFSRGSFKSRDQTQVSLIAGRLFYQLSHQGIPGLHYKCNENVAMQITLSKAESFLLWFIPAYPFPWPANVF